MPTEKERVKRYLGQRGTLRARELRARSISPVTLKRMVAAGELVQPSRGLYADPEQDVTANHDWKVACERVPQGVICLLSALAFHGIGTQNPREVWMAIDRKAWLPRIDSPPMRFVRFSGAARKTGVQETDGLRVYSPAKTVADCFKYRRKIGLDVGLEALRQGWRARKFTMRQLTDAARVCRVRRIIQPYLDTLT